MQIKVCGMRNPENIREITSLNPDLIGFIFYPKSPRNVSQAVEDGLFQHLTDLPNKVAVFVNEDLEMALEILKKHNFQYAQLHGSESVAYCEAIVKAGIRLLKVFSIDEQTDFGTMKAYVPLAEYFLFDTKSPAHGGTGQKFDWSLLQRYQLHTPVFLSGGIGPEDIQVLTQIKSDFPFIAGLDLNSKFELEPGLKNTAVLRQFIEQVRHLPVSL